MGLFSNKKHNLPKFPPTVIPLFRSLCEVLDQKGVRELREAVAATLAEHKGDQHSEIACAQALADCSFYLLDQYHKFDPKSQALIVGAVRYFSGADDALDEKTFLSGFHDDKQVMNYVLEELGIEDRYLELQ